MRPHAIIRLGSNYQVRVPREVPFKHKYRDISHLKIWSGCSQQPIPAEITGNPEDSKFD